MVTKEQIFDVIRRVLEQHGPVSVPIKESSVLYREGIGLDSLDTATLSALLEEEFGHDPYTREQFPRTVGDIVSYYQQGALS